MTYIYNHLLISVPAARVQGLLIPRLQQYSIMIQNDRSGEFLNILCKLIEQNVIEAMKYLVSIDYQYGETRS